jgi:hypothetical protein
MGVIWQAVLCWCQKAQLLQDICGTGSVFLVCVNGHFCRNFDIQNDSVLLGMRSKSRGGLLAPCNESPLKTPLHGAGWMVPTPFFTVLIQINK